MTGSAGRPGVVLLHGMARTRLSMDWMAAALRRAGFRTLNLDYRSRHKPLDALADEIHRPVTRFAASGHPVHFVTHSMGGLVVRAYLDREKPAWLGRVVMLGPPNQGSELADRLHGRRAYRRFFGPAGQQLTTAHGRAMLRRQRPVDYPLGIIAGTRPSLPLLSLVVPGEPSDGTVTVRSTRLNGMADHRVIAAGHSWLMFHPTVIAETILFLQHGRFSRPSGLRDGDGINMA